MPLNTAADYISQARVVLNDGDATGYRYTDATMLNALQSGVDDMRRLRPDLFIDDIDGDGSIVNAANTDMRAVDRQYRSALLDYVVAYCENSDDESADKGRSTSFRVLFASKLMDATV